MINSAMVARSFRAEAREYIGKMSFSPPETDLGFHGNWKAQLSRWPIPDERHLATAIDQVFWASLLVEEGRPCRTRLAYVPSEAGRPIHRLNKPVDLEPEALRKLAPVQGLRNCLTWKLVDRRPVITGVLVTEGEVPLDLVLASPTAGAVDIQWMGCRLVVVRGGKIARRSRNRLPGHHIISPYLATLFGNVAPVLLERVVRVIFEQGHGGSLWIVRDRSSLDAAGVKIGYAVKAGGLKPLEEQLDRRHAWLESIGRLAGVDGAVVLDGAAQVVGFGAFIPSEATTKVIRLRPTRKPVMVPASTLGGGRHRSAVTFCSTCAPAAAYVISEDGRISLIACDGDDHPPWCTELVTLGFSEVQP